MVSKIETTNSTKGLNSHWLAIGVVTAIFAVAHLSMWKNQIAQQVALDDLKNEINSVRSITNSVLNKLEGLPITASSEQFLFPTDQMFRGDLDADRW